MKLDEAKVILEENGFELLDEGKLGRALTAGALAFGSLIGNANAINQDDIDRFEKQMELSQSTSDVRRLMDGQTIKSYIKNGDYYFDVKFNKNIKRLIYKQNGDFILKVKDTHNNVTWIEHYFGKWKTSYNSDITLDELVGNLDLIKDFPTYESRDGDIKTKNSRIDTFIKNGVYYENNKKIYEFDGKKHLYYDENGEIRKVTISKRGKEGTLITKSLNSDGIIEDDF